MIGDQLQTIEINGIKYKINCKIGVGGAGVVFHVTSTLGDDFALKMVQSYTKNLLLKEAVDSQIKIQKLFSHEKYVIKCYGEKIIGNDMYILFELGQYSLRNKIQMNHLIQDEYIQMLIDVSYGIKSIHDKKSLHRDIKPENIIYSKGIFKITDFGTSTQNQKTNQMAGTCLYWAPQLLFDEVQEYTQALDIWSFGVLAFQAYFLIHPFFYNKNEKSHVKAMEELKKNIEVLTPKFTFPKLLTHLKKKGLNEKADFIERKLQGTHQALRDSFKIFFVRDPANRYDINTLLATFQSIQQHQINTVKIKSSRLLKEKQIHPQIDFFIQALNLSYKLNHDFKYKKLDEVQYCLELGLRFQCIKDFKGKDFIDYHCGSKITKHEKITKQYQNKIRQCLSEYFFYLKDASNLEFFSQLAILRFFILFCCCFFEIRETLKNFIQKVKGIIGIDMESLGQFRQMLPALTQRQFASLQNYIIARYFK